MKPSPLLLLPAAGYGKRMGFPVAKEMLPDPTGTPLIEFWLNLAQDLGWPALVITRRDKTNLIEFVQDRARQQNVNVQIIPPTRDVAETLLASRDFWSTWNIVGLPDTQFAPLTAAPQIAALLHTMPSVYATIDEPNASAFGGVLLEDERTGIFEKCAPPGLTKIWALFGFQNSIGVKLLETHLQTVLTAKPAFINWASGEVRLHRFRDLTRG